MNAYERHKQLMLDWQKFYSGRLPQPQQTAAKSDYDSLREAHRFIRSAEDDADDSWEARLARRYYAKLFREYAIADLSRHKVRAGSAVLQALCRCGEVSPLPCLPLAGPCGCYGVSKAAVSVVRYTAQ